MDRGAWQATVHRVTVGTHGTSTELRYMYMYIHICIHTYMHSEVRSRPVLSDGNILQAICINIKEFRGLPCGPVVNAPHCLAEGAWVQSLVGELRSSMLQCGTRNKRPNKIKFLVVALNKVKGIQLRSFYCISFKMTYSI